MRAAARPGAGPPAIRLEVAHPTFGCVVVPNFGSFGLLTFVTEIALGLGLLLGLLTRLTGLDGVIRKSLEAQSQRGWVDLARLAT